LYHSSFWNTKVIQKELFETKILQNFHHRLPFAACCPWKHRRKKERFPKASSAVSQEVRSEDADSGPMHDAAQGVKGACTPSLAWSGEKDIIFWNL
jgi:hypothetical protein